MANGAAIFLPSCATLSAQADNSGGTMADEKQNKCRNEVCNCQAQPDGKYCSASCEGKGDTIEIDCDCQHPECSLNF